jgi:phosphatidylglycerol:prolipoprotein diacylglycerol transferase
MTSSYWIHDLSPFLFRFSDTFGIRYYGLAYVIGFVGAWWLMLRAARHGRTTLPAALVGDFVVALVLGVLIGGRIGYFLLYQFAAVRADPSILLRIWEGGMSFHGGLVGVLVALGFYAWRHRQSFVHLGDLVASVAPLGLFLGRIANFINGELWGRPTDLPWAMVFPAAGPEPRHPSQLYEAALEGVVLFLVLRWATHRAGLLSRPGVVAGLFFAGYGLARILVETVREPDFYMPAFPLGLTMGMILSLPMVLFGAWLVRRGLAAGPGAGAR